MYLGGLITFLEARDPAIVVPLGFNRPHSYRGDYSELAFAPARNVNVSSMLAAARSALGTTYIGYKGGEYTMREYTKVHIAEYGSTGEEIGPILLQYMVGEL